MTDRYHRRARRAHDLVAELGLQRLLRHAELCTVDVETRRAGNAGCADCQRRDPYQMPDCAQRVRSLCGLASAGVTGADANAGAAPKPPPSATYRLTRFTCWSAWMRNNPLRDEYSAICCCRTLRMSVLPTRYRVFSRASALSFCWTAALSNGSRGHRNVTSVANAFSTSPNALSPVCAHTAAACFCSALRERPPAPATRRRRKWLRTRSPRRRVADCHGSAARRSRSLYERQAGRQRNAAASAPHSACPATVERRIDAALRGDDVRPALEQL